jgi:hypothetical protein
MLVRATRAHVERPLADDEPKLTFVIDPPAQDGISIGAPGPIDRRRRLDEQQRLFWQRLVLSAACLCSSNPDADDLVDGCTGASSFRPSGRDLPRLHGNRRRRRLR